MYNHAVTRVLVVMMVVACVSAVGAMGVEWRSIKETREGGAVEEAEAEAEGPVGEGEKE